jgi:hypothetical protein
MVYKIIISISAFFILIGCVGGKPFQPPPPEFKQWVRAGATEEDVKLMMLECGFSNSYGNAKMGDNEYAESQNCMIRRGFKHTSGFNICRNNSDLPACR